MVVLFDSAPSANKFYIIYYHDPITNENKFHFADNFELACNRAESILRDLPKEIPIKIHILEEVLTYVKHERENELKPKRKSERIKW